MGLRPLPSALASQKHEGSAPFEGGARSVQSKLLILLEGSEGGAQMELEERCLRKKEGGRLPFAGGTRAGHRLLY